MNKTLITLGIGIWGIMLILNFILRGSLVTELTCDEIAATLLPLLYNIGGDGNGNKYG